MKDEVEAVLESIRPMLINDGGNVELVDIDDGVVKVRLVGACTSCSSSTMTLKMGIEKALKKANGFIRSNLGKKLNVKRLPELSFQEDQTNSLL